MIKATGYVYVYLSYENDGTNWVYFDDLKVSYKKSQAVQNNSYYAFGLSAESWTRFDTKPNKYLYNAGSELNDKTGSYEMFFRSYDPAIGRMSGVDVMASTYAALSPYQYANNSPVVFNDPTGAWSSVYERASNGGCGCWRDKGPQDSGGRGVDYNLATYGSAAMGGSWAGTMGVAPSHTGLFEVWNDAIELKSGGMTEAEFIQKHRETFSGVVNLRYYMSDLDGNGAELVSHHMLYLVAGKLIAVYTYGKLAGEIQTSIYRAGSSLYERYASWESVFDTMKESIDATQPGIDRIGDVAGFLISAAETPFVAAAGELQLLGAFKDGFKTAYRPTARILNNYTRGALVGLRTTTRAFGTAGLVVGSGIAAYNLGTGNGELSDFVDLGVIALSAGTIAFVGITAAPFIAAGGILYGGFMLFGGEDLINNSSIGKWTATLVKYLCMKLLDWLFFTFYHATINRGSRFERASFALWFSSSFLWVAVFYLTLTLLSIRIVKPLFMLVFLTIFMINLLVLRRVYIKAERGKQVVKNKVVKEGYVLFARLFIFISIITSMAIMITMMIYYGKNVGYV